MSLLIATLKALILTCAFSLTVAHSPAYAAVGVDPRFEMQLPDLKADQSVPLKSYLDGSSDSFILLSFFSPDCEWCHRQMKAFNKLTASCDQTVKPIMIGIEGNSRELRAELRSAKVSSYPALKGTPAFMKDLGILATPWTLLLDGKGQLVANLRGYLTYDKLVGIFAEQCSAA